MDRSGEHSVPLVAHLGESSDGVTTMGCFAGHCDWRLPTIAELRSMLDPPGCASPCTSVLGFTEVGTYDFYWSSSAFVGPGA